MNSLIGKQTICVRIIIETNKELAAFIGCGLTKLREFAKELGLTKKKVA